jgi:hypothetical protein
MRRREPTRAILAFLTLPLLLAAVAAWHAAHDRAAAARWSAAQVGETR